MTVGAIAWVATRVGAEQLPGIRTLAAALDAVVVAESPAHLVLRTGRGDLLEYCAPGHPVPDHLFEHQDTVIGFAVDDLDGAAARLAAAALPAIAPAQAVDGARFQHFRGPDGRVLALVEETDRPGAHQQGLMTPIADAFFPDIASARTLEVGPSRTCRPVERDRR